MQVLLSLKEKDKWNSLLEKLPPSQQDVYFTPEYYSLYHNNGDGDAYCFVFKKDDKLALYPFLKNPISVLGYKLDKEYYDIQGAYGYNGLITSTSDNSFISSFWDAFDIWCKENDIIAEFMRYHPLLNNHLFAPHQMKTIYSRCTIALDLTDEDIWTHHISSKNRNMIRKAEKEGVTIVESDDYEAFRQLYNRTMTDLNADDFYFFPNYYYECFKQSFINNSMLCFAILRGKIIAGSMFMFSKYFAHYHLSARNREFSRYAANNLILWYAIQKAKKRGCKWFHLGGGTTDDLNDPLLHFKRGFSKETREFWIGKRIHNKIIYQEVLRQWQEKFPVGYQNNFNKLLGYRFL